MAPTRRRVLGAVTATFTLAGCLGGSGEGVGTDTETATETAMDEGTPTPTPMADGTATETSMNGGTETETGGGMGATVQVATHDELGEILVDSDGFTLYMFDSDTQGAGASTCSGGCASAWPPLTVDGEPAGGEGVTASLSTFERDDGGMQVTANGWPLYYYASDGSPGDANGQGASDVWWVLGPDGTPKRGGQTATETSDGIDY